MDLSCPVRLEGFDALAQDANQNFRTLQAGGSLSSQRLVQLMLLSLFSIHNDNSTDHLAASFDHNSNPPLRPVQVKGLGLAFSLFDCLLERVPPSDTSEEELLTLLETTLPCLGLFSDWLCFYPDVWRHYCFTQVCHVFL